MTPGGDTHPVVRYQGGGAEWRGGERLCVVIHRGRKLARLLDAGTLETYTMPLAELCRARPVPTVAPIRLARRLDQHRREWRRLGLIGKGCRRTDTAVRRAVDLLREAGHG